MKTSENYVGPLGADDVLSWFTSCPAGWCPGLLCGSFVVLLVIFAVCLLEVLLFVGRGGGGGEIDVVPLLLLLVVGPCTSGVVGRAAAVAAVALL